MSLLLVVFAHLLLVVAFRSALFPGSWFRSVPTGGASARRMDSDSLTPPRTRFFPALLFVVFVVSFVFFVI